MTQPQRSIAFIAGNKNPQKFASDPAFIYRCENPAAAAKEQGHNAHCLHINDCYTKLPEVDIAVFHRPCTRTWLQRWQFRQLIRRLRAQGTLLIADFDDRVFASDFAKDSPGVRNNYVSLKQTQKNFAQHQRVLNLFDTYTVSTTPLQQTLQPLVDGPVHWLPNAPHKSWYRHQPTATADNTFIIKYLPGTRSHDKDFALVADAVGQFLSKHKDAQLHITGVLDPSQLPHSLAAQKDQIIWQQKQPYDLYWQCVNAGHVHLAPLEDTPFNRCKSALKAIEAGFFNRPTIASPIPDMQRLASAGVSYAQTPTEWFEQLERHKQQPTSQYQALREAVLACYSAEQHAQAIVQLYEQQP